MKCTNKIRLLCLFGVAAVFMSGCNSSKISYENPYNTYETSAEYGISYSSSAAEKTFFAETLCVAEDVNTVVEDQNIVHSQTAEASGVFNLVTNTVTYSQNIYQKMYPASTTKIMTAYVALKYGNLDDYVTISENAANQSSDSSVCGLKKGDVIQLRDLLYGLLMKSGNDAAVAIAEHISGSEAAFVELMNKEALAMGASTTHFVNPHGLPDENHYTSVYDLYLMMQNAVKYTTFTQILNTESYDVVYTNENGETVNETWSNSNRYLNGKVTAPDGVTVVGGKTGTTRDAGYCLVLYSYNQKNEPIISIVLKTGGPSDLYLLMNDLLTNYAN